MGPDFGSARTHRSQYDFIDGFTRNMRLAPPNATFIGFTGTLLFKHDELTKRIFGNYISRHDFKRSGEGGVLVTPPDRPAH